MKSAMLRIQNDLKEINPDDFNKNIAYAKLEDGHPLVVKASVIGPRSTTYEGTIFEVKIQFSDNYPVKKQKTFLHQFIHFIFLLVFITYNYSYDRSKSS
jgi:ubiquitin-protein ligase